MTEREERRKREKGIRCLTHNIKKRIVSEKAAAAAAAAAASTA